MFYYISGISRNSYMVKHFSLSGYHTLYEWYRSMESEHFPDPTGLRARMEQWTFGLYPACIKYLMSAFDVPEVMASLHKRNSLAFFVFHYMFRNDLFCRLWLWPEVKSARKEWSPSHAAVPSSTMLLYSCTSGSSPLLLYHWYLAAICTFASIGLTYTLMKLSHPFASQIIRHLHVFISLQLVTLKFLPLHLIR